MRLIDAHAHLPLDTPESIAFLESHDLAIVNICVASNELGGLDAQRDWYRTLTQNHPHRFAWVTSFDPTAPTDDIITQLDADFSAGAVACKVWKHLGMELKDDFGNFLLVDHPRFTPIFDHLSDKHRPLLMHIAEPIDCWLPLDPASPHYSYYSKATHWHWHGKPNVLSHAQLITSRNHILKRHPHLKIIGCHFGSQEHDLGAVTALLDAHPNYHIDTGARLANMALHARTDIEAIRRFFHRYKDRILWGIDWVWTKPASARQAEWPKLHSALTDRLRLELAFLSSSETLTIQNQPTPSLSLPPDIIEKITLTNARRLYFPFA